jgi:hypothetical protein
LETNFRLNKNEELVKIPTRESFYVTNSVFFKPSQVEELIKPPNCDKSAEKCTLDKCMEDIELTEEAENLKRNLSSQKFSYKNNNQGLQDKRYYNYNQEPSNYSHGLYEESFIDLSESASEINELNNLNKKKVNKRLIQQYNFYEKPEFFDKKKNSLLPPKYPKLDEVKTFPQEERHSQELKEMRTLNLNNLNESATGLKKKKNTNRFFLTSFINGTKKKTNQNRNSQNLTNFNSINSFLPTNTIQHKILKNYSLPNTNPVSPSGEGKKIVFNIQKNHFNTVNKKKQEMKNFTNNFQNSTATSFFNNKYTGNVKNQKGNGQFFSLNLLEADSMIKNVKGSDLNRLQLVKKMINDFSNMIDMDISGRENKRKL